MASILLDMHDRNCVCFMSISIVYIICNGSFFFLLLNVQIFPMSMSETISYLPNMARFSLKKPNKILCGKTPITGIIVVCVDAHCSEEVTDLICSFIAPSSAITLANSTWFIMLHFKFLVSLLNVILKISPSQRSEQKGKNEINPKDITQYQNMRYIFLHLVATESSICITSWKR